MHRRSPPAEDASGVTVDDIAKRLIDYGFHAPTMSFPVPGTLMIEPTESESKAELDRFCDAMIAIRREIAEIENGRWKVEASPLRHAPHTVHDIADDAWERAYTRAEGCFPAGTSRTDKYWCPVGRVDNVYGDRNLVCSCPPIDGLRAGGGIATQATGVLARCDAACFATPTGRAESAPETGFWSELSRVTSTRSRTVRRIPTPQTVVGQSRPAHQRSIGLCRLKSSRPARTARPSSVSDSWLCLYR